jgi:hypothetical protein
MKAVRKDPTTDAICSRPPGGLEIDFGETKLFSDLKHQATVAETFFKSGDAENQRAPATVVDSRALDRDLARLAG